MPAITYRSLDGAIRAVEAPVGSSVVRGAFVNGIAGIVEECGGAECAICHVYVDSPAHGSDQ